VLGFAQLLSQQLDEGDIAEQRRSVAHIEDAGWHLLTLIDDVLDIAGIERGRLALRLEPIALAPEVRTLCESMTAFAQQRGVTIHAGDLPAAATVLADATRLRQVLRNLLGNAIKYGRAGGSVTLTFTREPAAWRLSVADDGIGISAMQMAHLFEPFNRLGRERSGVGLGLVLSRWLVEAMNGSLSVQSTEGTGSTFSVSLPDAPAVAQVRKRR
jgi:signal transduction histidine kinase